MTEAEVVTRLGLQDPALFERNAQWANLERLMAQPCTLGRQGLPMDYIVRRTGRTTRVVVKALVKLSERSSRGTFTPLYLAGRSHKSTIFMVDQAKTAAAALGLDPNLLQETGWQSLQADFRDHE